MPFLPSTLFFHFFNQTAAVYPENRRAEVTETLKALTTAHVPRKNIRKYIADSQGIDMLPQDVYNLTRKLSVCHGTDSEGVEDVLKGIRDEGGCTKFGVNESGEFQYVLFMTSDMKKDLMRFPDILVMDATYKVNKYLYPLVNVMCVDAEGEGRPVMHGFVVSENRANAGACLNFLKSVMIDASFAPAVFFVDKDLSEIAAVHDIFPEAFVRLCSFHTSTAVKRALKNHGLSSQQLEVMLSLFKEQRDTRSAEKYHEITYKIRQDAPDKTVRYFETNWWNQPDMWAAHTRLHLQTLHLTTTNHVESYHSKIKHTLNPHTRLTDCIKTLLDHDADLVRTKDIKSHLHSISHSYNVRHTDPQLENIINQLTDFSGRLVVEQYRLAKTVSYTHTSFATASSSPTSQSHMYKVSSYTAQQNIYTASTSSCNCEFFSSFNLPCRHIFSLRLYLGQTLYTSDLLANSRFLRTEQTDRDRTPNSPHATDILPTRHAAHTQEGRYRIVSAVTKRLNGVFQVMGEACFKHRMEQLEQFLQLVAADKQFCILEVTGSETMTPPNTDTVPPTDLDTTETMPLTDLNMIDTVPPTDLDTTEAVTVGNTDKTETVLQTAVVTTETENHFGTVKLPKVKVRGRPRNVQAFTRQGKRRWNTQQTVRETAPCSDIKRKVLKEDITEDNHVAKTDDMVLTDCETPAAIGCDRVSLNVCESVDATLCYACGKKDVAQDQCEEESVIRVQCKQCPRSFHKCCLSSAIRVKNFVCMFCLPAVIKEMKGVLDDCTHNMSFL